MELPQSYTKPSIESLRTCDVVSMGSLLASVSGVVRGDVISTLIFIMALLWR